MSELNVFQLEKKEACSCLMSACPQLLKFVFNFISSYSWTAGVHSMHQVIVKMGAVLTRTNVIGDGIIGMYPMEA